MESSHSKAPPSAPGRLNRCSEIRDIGRRRPGRRAPSYGSMTLQQERSWRVHDEQHLGSFGRGSLKRVSGDLPDGVSFDQYVILLPQSVTVAAVDSAGAVLMVRRHRFILDRWVWELPGGYVEEGEDLDVAAVAALEMTAPPYEWATRTIGPSTVRRSTSRSAASLPSSRSGFAPIVSRCRERASVAPAGSGHRCLEWHRGHRRLPSRCLATSLPTPDGQPTREAALPLAVS